MTARFQDRRFLGGFTQVIYTRLFSGFWQLVPFVNVARPLRHTHRISPGERVPFVRT